MGVSPNNPYKAISRANFITVERFGCSKNVLKKEKYKFFKLTCLFLQKKVDETVHDMNSGTV